MDLDALKKECLKVKEYLLNLDSRVLIVAQEDSDGITSAYLLKKLLKDINVNFDLETYSQLNSNIIYDLEKRENKVIIFLDCGSSYLTTIGDSLKDKKIIIFDHHQISGQVTDNMYHINIRDFDVDNDMSGCTSTLLYYFINIFNDYKKLSPVAILGSIGDFQIKYQLLGLNKLTVDDAVSEGLIEFKEDLNIFGKHSKLLHKALLRADFKVSKFRTERDVMSFLYDIGIYESGKPRMPYSALSDENKELLIDELRSLAKVGENLFANSITFLFDVELKDAFEYTTLINSQVRMGEINIAQNLCGFTKEAIDSATENRKKYQSGIKHTMDKISDYVYFKDDKKVILNVTDKVPKYLFSTISSIVAKSRIYEEGTIVFLVGIMDQNSIKLSSRISGLSKQKKINLRNILEKHLGDLTQDFGGHYEAAGALFHRIDYDSVLDRLKNI